MDIILFPIDGRNVSTVGHTHPFAWTVTCGFQLNRRRPRWHQTYVNWLRQSSQSYLPHLLWAQSTRLEAKMISFLLKRDKKRKKKKITYLFFMIIYYRGFLLCAKSSSRVNCVNWMSARDSIPSAQACAKSHFETPQNGIHPKSRSKNKSSQKMSSIFTHTKKTSTKRYHYRIVEENCTKPYIDFVQ